MGNIMNPITTEKTQFWENKQTITSLEVAEMVEKEHNELLKDIRRYCEQLSVGKIPQSDFFGESTYKTDRGKEYPCFNVTKNNAILHYRNT